PRLMKEAMCKVEAGELEVDKTLRHHGLVAETRKEGEGGHYWILCGGDIVLFASTQVPAAERDTWNPAFQRVMASLQLTRDAELLWRQLPNEVPVKLRERFPD